MHTTSLHHTHVYDFSESQEEAISYQEAIWLWSGHHIPSGSYQRGRPPCQTGWTEGGVCGGTGRETEGGGARVILSSESNSKVFRWDFLEFIIWSLKVPQTFGENFTNK